MPHREEALANHHAPADPPSTDEGRTFSMATNEILAKARRLDEATGRCTDIRDLLENEAEILDGKKGPPEEGQSTQKELLELADTLGISRESLFQVLSLPRLSHESEFVRTMELADSMDPLTLLKEVASVALRELNSRPFLRKYDDEGLGFRCHFDSEYKRIFIGEGSELSAMRQMFSTDDAVVYKSDWIRAKINTDGERICYFNNPTALRLLGPIFKRYRFTIIRNFFIPPARDILRGHDQGEALVTDESTGDRSERFSLDMVQIILQKAEALDAAAANRQAVQKIALDDTQDRSELDRDALYEQADALSVSRESVRQVLSLLHLSLDEQRMDNLELADRVSDTIFLREINSVILEGLRGQFGASHTLGRKVGFICTLHYGEVREPTKIERLLASLCHPFRKEPNICLNKWISIDLDSRECHIYKKEVLTLLSSFLKAKGFKIIFKPE